MKNAQSGPAFKGFINNQQKWNEAFAPAYVQRCFCTQVDAKSFAEWPSSPSSALTSPKVSLTVLAPCPQPSKCPWAAWAAWVLLEVPLADLEDLEDSAAAAAEALVVEVVEVEAGWVAKASQTKGLLAMHSPRVLSDGLFASLWHSFSVRWYLVFSVSIMSNKTHRALERPDAGDPGDEVESNGRLYRIYIDKQILEIWSL
jgi:hypothetical protein